MGTLIRENKRKIALSLNMGFLLMGCLMLTIGAYPAIYSVSANETRIAIGSTCIAVWFVFFPVLSRETKDKTMAIVGLYSLVALLVLLIFSWEVYYILHNLEKGYFWLDILFSVAGIIVCAYLCYIFISFIKNFYFLIQKVSRLLFPNSTAQNVSGIVHLLQMISSLIVSLTAFVGSLTAACVAVQTFLEYIH